MFVRLIVRSMVLGSLLLGWPVRRGLRKRWSTRSRSGTVPSSRAW